MSNENPKDGVDYILGGAIASRASDVHIDQIDGTLHIRFRVDGLLYPISNFLDNTFFLSDSQTIIQRIKILSQADISEHRLPQDGDFEYQLENRAYNIRASLVPASHGESIVLRILNREDTMFNLADLGLEKEQLAILNHLIAIPHGLILITGPTGSGKTTLFYSILNALNKPVRNIISIEDPIELRMNGIRQLQIRENIGLTFAKFLRSVVRQDPDVIMLGEIRDRETAEMAVQIASIGIMLVSTFHTFDIPSLIVRLTEMEIPPSIMAQSISGVISTRLVRKICTNCKADYELSEYEKKFLDNKMSQLQGVSFKKGKGCAKCNQTGYSYRTGINEIVAFDESLRAAIISKASSMTLNTLIQELSGKSLMESAISKIVQGITTVEEVIRIVGFS